MTWWDACSKKFGELYRQGGEEKKNVCDKIKKNNKWMADKMAERGLECAQIYGLLLTNRKKNPDNFRNICDQVLGREIAKFPPTIYKGTLINWG